MNSNSSRDGPSKLRVTPTTSTTPVPWFVRTPWQQQSRFKTHTAPTCLDSSGSCNPIRQGLGQRRSQRKHKRARPSATVACRGKQTMERRCQLSSGLVFHGRRQRPESTGADDRGRRALTKRRAWFEQLRLAPCLGQKSWGEGQRLMALLDGRPMNPGWNQAADDARQRTRAKG